MALVNTLTWRYATKQFDPTKKLSEDQVTELLRGMNLAPSSLGLQPYEFVVIHDKSLQEELMQHSFNQSQIRDASHVVVIAAKKEVSQNYVDDYIDRTAQLRKVSIESLTGYRDMINGFLAGKQNNEILHWTQKQCYIVLGVLMSLCADMHIDSCPMEGFVPEEYNRILKLDEKGLHATLVVPVGYRTDDDSYAKFEKTRHELDEITSLHYDQ